MSCASKICLSTRKRCSDLVCTYESVGLYQQWKLNTLYLKSHHRSLACLCYFPKAKRRGYMEIGDGQYGTRNSLPASGYNLHGCIVPLLLRLPGPRHQFHPLNRVPRDPKRSSGDRAQIGIGQQWMLGCDPPRHRPPHHPRASKRHARPYATGRAAAERLRVLRK